MPKFNVKISDEVKEFMDKMDPEDREELEKEIKKLERNPFVGESCAPGPEGWYRTIGMKLKWLWREIELLFTKNK